jgi:sulfite oxidase
MNTIKKIIPISSLYGFGYLAYKPKKKEELLLSTEELKKYNNPNDKILVSYKENIYNITDFINLHPGGSEKIMLAAGNSIDEYWKIYPQHYKNAFHLLEPMKVGKLTDYKPKLLDNDLFENEPNRENYNLKYHTIEPCNAENCLGEEIDFITSVNDWYIRNHHPVPNLNIENYQFNLINNLNSSSYSKTYKLNNLNSIFKSYKTNEIISTIQCGGNRRGEFENTNGTQWDYGAISTAKWKGYRLYDFLLEIEPKLDELQNKHIILESYDTLKVSIPIEKVLRDKNKVILAFEMNNLPLDKDHGYPLRLIVPGYVGIRNVKWIKNIILSDEEADSNVQKGIAYKGLPHYIKGNNLDNLELNNYYTTNEMPVQSCITFPKNGYKLENVNNKFTIKGYAYSGGGRGIIRVDVSIDGGETWMEADLLEGSEQNKNTAWAWTLWKLDVEIPKVDNFFDDDYDVINDISTIRYNNNKIKVICKATDSSYNTQPKIKDYIWNIRGINNNSWHMVEVFL